MLSAEQLAAGIYGCYSTQAELLSQDVRFYRAVLERFGKLGLNTTTQKDFAVAIAELIREDSP